MNDRVTFRLGPLAGALAAYCKKHDTTPSEATRLALAKLLRAKPPKMVEGNPAFLRARKPTG
jgi:hypothetical protein